MGKCQDCKYFEKIETSAIHGKKELCEGRCHRWINPVEGHIFAAVYLDDWCGEFEQK